MKKTLAMLMALIMLLGMVPAAMAEAPADITSWIIVENPEKLEGELEFWIPFKGSQGMDDMIAELRHGCRRSGRAGLLWSASHL